MKIVLAVVVAAVAVFVVSSVWYVVFAKSRSALLGSPASDASAEDKPSPAKVLLELGRSALVAAVIAGLAAQLELTSVGPVLVLGLALFAGFPFVLLTGSVIWDGVNPRLAAIHAGDWLLKLLVISLVVGLFR